MHGNSKLKLLLTSLGRIKSQSEEEEALAVCTTHRPVAAVWCGATQREKAALSPLPGETLPASHHPHGEDPRAKRELVSVPSLQGSGRVFWKAAKCVIETRL